MEINLPLPLPQLFLASQRGRLPLQGNSAIHVTGVSRQNVLSIFPLLGGSLLPVSALMSLSINAHSEIPPDSLQTLSLEEESSEPAQGVYSDSQLPDHVRRRGCSIKVKLATS